MNFYSLHTFPWIMDCFHTFPWNLSRHMLIHVLRILSYFSMNHFHALPWIRKIQSRTKRNSKFKDHSLALAVKIEQWKIKQYWTSHLLRNSSLTGKLMSIVITDGFNVNHSVFTELLGFHQSLEWWLEICWGVDFCNLCGIWIHEVNQMCNFVNVADLSNWT